MRYALALLVVLFAAACSSSPMAGHGQSMTVIGIAPPAVASEEYRIGVGDVLNITVFQVGEMSAPGAQVDSTGNVQMPLLGSMRAANLTPGEFSEAVRVRLAQRYLQNPNVSVSVASSASQKITVDGAVEKPGVYEMRGRTTLAQAIAMAEGVSQVSDLKSVAVFRNVDGQRMVAVFDVTAIRTGQSEDPVLLGDDIVLVDSSRVKSLVQGLTTALPGLSVFRPF